MLLATALAGARPRRHAAYLELLGKGGLWGIGYDYQAWTRIALGGTGSISVMDGEQVTSLSPYATFYAVGRRRHRLFLQLGPQLVRVERSSPVPEWPGMSSTGLGGQLSMGYELRTRFLLRAFVMGAVGKGGAAPWLGVSLGFTR